MRGEQARLVMGALALAAIWVVVYWITPAGTAGRVRVDDDRAPTALVQRTVQPPALPPPQQQSRPAETTRYADAVSRPAAEPPAPKPQPTGVIPPAFRTRTIGAGETMQSVARAELGDSRHWEAIARANPTVDPLKLKAGMTLRIPADVGNIQGVEVKPPPAPTPSQTEYVVKSGDTLGAIAKATLGSSSRWQEIMDANREVISRPEALRPGMRLRIPSR